MNSTLPSKTAPMVRRARVLHLVCQSIAAEISQGVPVMQTYANGRARFNRSLLARKRGKLSGAAIRWNFARWKLNPSPSCFLGRWGSSGPGCRIAPAFVREIGEQAIRSGLSLSEVYRQKPPQLSCSASSLYKRLTGAPFRAVRDARRKLDRATATALRVLKERTGNA